MKEYDKLKSHISSKIHMIYMSLIMLDTLLLRRVSVLSSSISAKCYPNMDSGNLAKQGTEFP